jgi:hypothetical protein
MILTPFTLTSSIRFGQETEGHPATRLLPQRAGRTTQMPLPFGDQKSEVSSQKSDVKEQWTEITGQKAKDSG